jgi:hypothetical protein
MFYVPQISPAPTGEPPRFDPMLGGERQLRHVSSGEIRPEEVTPRFIGIGGRRSTVTGWRSALRVALRAANQEVRTLSELSDLCGLDLRPGPGHPNASYDRDLDACVPSLSTGRNAEALFRLLDRLGRSAHIRVSAGETDLLVEHRPRRHEAPQRSERPQVTQDQLIQAAERGEVAYGSFVEISVAGMFDHRVFRLGGAGSDPRRGELSVSSPVGKALLGLTAGAETEYRAGPARRRIDLHAVDNRLVLSRLGQSPEPDASPDPA